MYSNSGFYKLKDNTFKYLIFCILATDIPQ